MAAKNIDSREIKGWDTTRVPGEGVKLRFLYASAKPGQFDEGPWFLLDPVRCKGLAEALLEEAGHV